MDSLNGAATSGRVASPALRAVLAMRIAGGIQTWLGHRRLIVRLLALGVLVGLTLGAAFGYATVTRQDRFVQPTGRQSTTEATPATPVAPGGAVGTGTGSTLLTHQEPGRVDAGIDWGTAGRGMLSIGVVLALIVGAARLLKRFAGHTGGISSAGGTIRVLETIYLPAPSGRGRAAIHLMEIGGRRLVIGATDTQLNLLSEVEDPDWAVPVAVPPAAPATAPAKAPGELANDLSEDGGIPLASPAPPLEVAEVLHRLKEIEQRYRVTRAGGPGGPTPSAPPVERVALTR